MEIELIEPWKPGVRYNKTSVVRFMDKIKVCTQDNVVNILPIKPETVIINSIITVDTNTIINNLITAYGNLGYDVVADDQDNYKWIEI